MVKILMADTGFADDLNDERQSQGRPLVSERRVWRLCNKAGSASEIVRRKGRYQRSGEPVHDDLLRCDFTAGGSNQVWVTDITEHHAKEGKLYMCGFKAPVVKPDRWIQYRQTNEGTHCG